MKKYLSAIFFFTLVFSINTISGQTLSNEKAVISPFISVDELIDPDILILRKYEPFDDFTLFSPKFGAQVYKDEDITINMFSIAYSSGDVDEYHSDMKLALMFIAFENSNMEVKIPLKNQEIIFLINSERHVFNIEEENFVTFKDHNTYQKLYESENVRARISFDNNQYEIDMSRETRTIIGVLLSEIKF